MTDRHTDVVGFLDPGTGALSGSAAFDPLGQVLSRSGHQAALGYQSAYTSATTGKVDMSARWYNPKTGQFTGKDPVSNASAPASVNANPFAYGNDNPLSATDPSGHRAFYDGDKGQYTEDPVAVKATFQAMAYAVQHPAPTADPVVDAYAQIADDRCGGRMGCYYGRLRALGTIKIGQDGHTITGNPSVIADLQAAAASLEPPADPPHRQNCGWNPSTWFGCAKNFAADHPTIAGVVAGLATFAVCEGGSLGVGTVGCAAIAGAAGNMVTHWGQCASGSSTNCSLGSYVATAAVGAVTGALTAGLAEGLGPIAGGLVSRVIGEEASVGLGEAAFGAPIQVYYGLTETGGVCLVSPSGAGRRW